MKKKKMKEWTEHDYSVLGEQIHSCGGPKKLLKELSKLFNGDKEVLDDVKSKMRFVGYTKKEIG